MAQKIYFNISQCLQSNTSSARPDWPGEQILRELLGLHPSSVAGGQRELVAEQLGDDLHCCDLAVAVQGKPGAG